jgi:hypothetical protein
VKRTIVFFTALIISGLAACSTGQAASGRENTSAGIANRNSVSGEYIFTAGQSVTKQDVLSAVKQYEVTGSETVSEGVYLLKFKEDPGAETLTKLVDGKKIKAVQPNFIYHTNKGKNNAQ